MTKQLERTQSNGSLAVQEWMIEVAGETVPTPAESLETDFNGAELSEVTTGTAIFSDPVRRITTIGR